MSIDRLPLEIGDAVILDGLRRTVIQNEADQAVLRGENGVDITLTAAQALESYRAEKLVYDNPLLRALEKGGFRQQRLAAHARRPLAGYSEKVKLEIERNHYIATRADQFFSEYKGVRGYAKRPGADEGYDKFAALMNKEIAALHRAGVDWAAAEPGIKRNFARNIHRRWELTQSKAALAPMNWAKGVRQSQPQTAYVERILRRILEPLWLHMPWNNVADVYHDFIVPALVVAWSKGKITRKSAPPVSQIYKFIERTFDAAEVARRRGTPVEVARLHRIKKIIQKLSPLERIEIDSTELEEDVCYYDTQGVPRTLSRPWGTFALDVATNVNVGLFISWDHPSYDATRRVLRHALWPKDKSALCGSINAWPSGKAKNDRTRIVADRGSENDNDPLPWGLGALKLAFTLTRGRSPKSKASIERHIGTITKNKSVPRKDHRPLPLKMRSSNTSRLLGHYGKKFAKTLRKGGPLRPWVGKTFANEAEARAQLPAIIRWYTHRIVDHYNVRRPARGGESPLARFNRLSAGKTECPPFGDRIFLGEMLERAVAPEGVRVGPYLFTADEFDEILARRSDVFRGRRKKHRIFHDPENPQRIKLFDQPDRKIPRWIDALPRNPEALEDETFESWRFRDAANRAEAKDERTYERLSADRAARKRRDANNQKSEAALAEDLAKINAYRDRRRTSSASQTDGRAKAPPACDPPSPPTPVPVKTQPETAPWRKQPEGGLDDFFSDLLGDRV